MPDETSKQDKEPLPIGVYRDGGKPGPDGKHFGGRVVDANGNVLATYEPKEENPGADGFEFDQDKQRVVPVKAKHKADDTKPHAK